MKLWVDDERPAPNGWVGVRTASEAIQMLAQTDVDEVSLDHDLGPDEDAYAALLWIEERVFNDDSYIPPRIYIHTANVSARKKMELALEAIERQVQVRRDESKEHRG